MTHIKEDHNKDINQHVSLEEKNERRLNQLMDLVERHTRTERHLEQHSDISDLDELKHTLKLQEEREKEIDNLKDLIVSGVDSFNDEMKNLERNYRYTNNYLSHNTAHMDDATLELTKEKQEHRREQMNWHIQNR